MSATKSSVPMYMRRPMSIVCHPLSTVAEVRLAIELTARLRKKCGASPASLSALKEVVVALRRVERGVPLADAFGLSDAEREETRPIHFDESP